MHVCSTRKRNKFRS